MKRLTFLFLLVSSFAFADDLLSSSQSAFVTQGFRSQEHKVMTKKIAELKDKTSAYQFMHSQNADQFIEGLQVFAYFIPQQTSLCIENPTTFKCDEGDGLETLFTAFSTAFSAHPRSEEVRNLIDKFMAYKIEREWNKLRVFIKRKEAGAHGSLTRILNQAFRVERLLTKEEDRQQIYKNVITYMNELKQLVSANPQIRGQLFPDYRQMDFDAVIADYSTRLKN
jgi:hypothetical protein